MESYFNAIMILLLAIIFLLQRILNEFKNK